MSVCWHLSVFHYQGHIAQVSVVVQLHDAVQHLDFARGLLLLRRWFPPQNLDGFAHGVTSYWNRFLSWDAQPASNHHHAVLQRATQALNTYFANLL